MDQNQFEGLHTEPKSYTDQGGTNPAAADRPGDTATAAETYAEQVTGKLQQGYERARDKFNDKFSDVSRQAHDATAAVKDRAGTMGEAVEATIHQRPLLAIATAAAIGYVIAFMIHRK